MSGVLELSIPLYKLKIFVDSVFNNTGYTLKYVKCLKCTNLKQPNLLFLFIFYPCKNSNIPPLDISRI